VEVRDLTAWLQHTQPEKYTSLPPSQSRASFCSCYLFFAANPLACQEPGSRNVEQARKVKLLLGLEYSIKGKDKRHFLQFLFRKMHRPMCFFSDNEQIFEGRKKSFEYLLIVGEEMRM
jgi:hypothetical protein